MRRHPGRQYVFKVVLSEIVPLRPTKTGRTKLKSWAADAVIVTTPAALAADRVADGVPTKLPVLVRKGTFAFALATLCAPPAGRLQAVVYDAPDCAQ